MKVSVLGLGACFEVFIPNVAFKIRGLVDAVHGFVSVPAAASIPDFSLVEVEPGIDFGTHATVGEQNW